MDSVAPLQRHHAPDFCQTGALNHTSFIVDQEGQFRRLVEEVLPLAGALT
jgi:hypothetical protein